MIASPVFTLPASVVPLLVAFDADTVVLLLSTVTFAVTVGFTVVVVDFCVEPMIYELIDLWIV